MYPRHAKLAVPKQLMHPGAMYLHGLDVATTWRKNPTSYIYVV